MDGYSVDWVEWGDYVILVIEQYQYDCVFLDCGLLYVIGDDILLKVCGKNFLIFVIFFIVCDSI